eukprot:TRINITY_DN1121_c2_g2_i1.p2 TRINITY_DN1121_c2_g2~~TRINITY_DN1121_c2_g2_i1.p2  ORF type:complete len:241 (-),score=29.74 TRINITY_DN1121_c2_g2_i1:510-1232(-)
MQGYQNAMNEDFFSGVSINALSAGQGQGCIPLSSCASLSWADSLPLSSPSSSLPAPSVPSGSGSLCAPDMSGLLRPESPQEQIAVVTALAKQFQETAFAAQTQAVLSLLFPLVNDGGAAVGGGYKVEAGLEEDKFAKPGNNLYKTEMCRSFEETGVCKYGKKCQYAHGEHELRQTVKHPKFKTVSCETILKGGVCPYGKRCRFLHPSDIEKASILAHNTVEHHHRLPVFESLTLKDRCSA